MVSRQREGPIRRRLPSQVDLSAYLGEEVVACIHEGQFPHACGRWDMQLPDWAAASL